MRPRRPLRSVFLGNPRYLSVYALGVAQAMGILGHWHRSVSIFDDIDDVKKQIEEMSPDVIWTHMALWPPPGALTDVEIASILMYWKRRGAAVYLHDGDPRERKTEIDVGSAFSIALVNRSVESQIWGVPCLRWPYAAMVQKEIPPLCIELDLLFAGHLRSDALYGERTTLVNMLQAQLRRAGYRMLIVSPGGGDVNNRMLVADVVARTGAVLGLARPDVPGWVDTRCFQFPGAGGVLIHDDAGEFLVPNEHYLKFDRANAVESILGCVKTSAKKGPEIRERAFKHVQANHTWVQRCEQALAAFYGG